MARKKTVEINGNNYEFKAPEARWYFEMVGEFKMGTRDQDMEGYYNTILKNCVLSPAELRSKGIDYFGDNIYELNKVIKEMTNFFHEPPEPKTGIQSGKGET